MTVTGTVTGTVTEGVTVTGTVTGTVTVSEIASKYRASVVDRFDGAHSDGSRRHHVRVVNAYRVASPRSRVVMARFDIGSSFLPSSLPLGCLGCTVFPPLGVAHLRPVQHRGNSTRGSE